MRGRPITTLAQKKHFTEPPQPLPLRRRRDQKPPPALPTHSPSRWKRRGRRPGGLAPPPHTPHTPHTHPPPAAGPEAGRTEAPTPLLPSLPLRSTPAGREPPPRRRRQQQRRGGPGSRARVSPARPRSHRTRWAPGPAGKRSAPRNGGGRPTAGVGGSRARHRGEPPPPPPRRPAPAPSPPPPSPPLSGAAAAAARSKEAGSWAGFLTGQRRVEDGPIRSRSVVGGGGWGGKGFTARAREARCWGTGGGGEATCSARGGGTRRSEAGGGRAVAPARWRAVAVRGGHAVRGGRAAP